MTGSDCVDTDFTRREFKRQTLGERFDRSFRRRVEQSSHHGMGANDRTEVVDAFALNTEPLDRFLHGENRSENVDVVVEVKALLRDVRESAEPEYPGVIDQNVQPAKC